MEERHFDDIAVGFSNQRAVVVLHAQETALDKTHLIVRVPPGIVGHVLIVWLGCILLSHADRADHFRAPVRLAGAPYHRYG